MKKSLKVKLRANKSNSSIREKVNGGREKKSN